MEDDAPATLDIPADNPAFKNLTMAQQTTLKKHANLNQEEVLFLVELFNKFDADHSQTIDAKELRPLMKEFGVELSKKATTKLLQRTVPAGGKNPSVNLDDFLKMMTPYVRKKMGPHMETNMNLNPFELLVMKREFSRADCDGSGFIDERELAAILKKPVADCRTLIQKFHKGDSPDLDFNEFVHIKVHLKTGGGE